MLTNLHSESDRIDPTWSANDFDQGVYAMASAYGGTVSRLLLPPLEERARAKAEMEKASSPSDAGLAAQLAGWAASLGGSALTLMIACCSPLSRCVEVAMSW